MSKEAMKLALEALELAKRSHGMMLLSDPPQEAWKTYRVDDSLNKAITALREALAGQPAQQQEPEYAWPTVADYERDVGFQTNEAFRIAWNMARTTNRMLGHTSLQPAQQEPVECKTLCELCVKRSYHFCANSAQTTLIPSPPAQRTWVGLTFAEICECENDYLHIFARAIEAKLKEKNA